MAQNETTILEESLLHRECDRFAVCMSKMSNIF